jgi:hypothetical protein
MRYVEKKYCIEEVDTSAAWVETARTISPGYMIRALNVEPEPFK